jgi:hypothetical protein
MIPAEFVIECSSGEVRRATSLIEWPTRFAEWKADRHRAEAERRNIPAPFPLGHLMFERPTGYGCVPCDWTGAPALSDSFLRTARAWVARAMRNANRTRNAAAVTHYTERMAAQERAWTARAVCRFLRQHGSRFPMVTP